MTYNHFFVSFAKNIFYRVKPDLWMGDYPISRGFVLKYRTMSALFLPDYRLGGSLLAPC